MSVILVVDDRPSNRDYLSMLLGYGGHRVIQASDGREGLTSATSDPPDLVISDVMMPTMDGYEFVRSLRQDASLALTPVIFCTAHYLDEEALALAAKCGVSNVLPKPCEPSELLKAVNTALGVSISQSPLPPEVHQEHLELITTRLSKTADELGCAVSRLEAMIEAGQQLSTEHDPSRLVAKYAHIAREIVGAGQCVVGMFGQDGMEWADLASSGLSGEAAAELPIRWRPGCAGAGLLFGDQEILEVPVRTAERLCGWLCVASKPGGGRFSEDDGKFAQTLAAQLAIAYENARLYRQVRQYAEELEDKVERRTRALQNAKEELESFTCAVSHDLRSPLHLLNGFASVLKDRFSGELSPEADDLVGRIHRISLQMADLVHDLMELSRISQKEIRLEPVNLNGVLALALDESRSAEDLRRVQWRTCPLPTVEGAPTLLKQVFTNLISNAIKFTSRTPAPVIEIGQAEVDGNRVVYVRDNGAGFDPRRAQRLFHVFQRLHDQAEYPGTGAGLAIVHRILSRHGWRIWAESAPGEGATFYFTVTQQASREVGSGREEPSSNNTALLDRKAV